MCQSLTEMVKSDILVIVPSHIKSLEQLDYLRRCLNSLINQTYEADILVSISFNKPYSLDFSEFPQVSFIVSEEQKYQMEHLYILSHEITPYKLIMFCDDDDTYQPTRVETFRECFYQEPSLIGIREASKASHTVPEYWAYGLVPSVIEDFFYRMRNDMNLLRHKFSDVYFRNYLFLTKDKPFLTFNTPLYNYTTNNPNSICTVHKAGEYMADEILLQAKNPDDEVFEKVCKDLVLTANNKSELIAIIDSLEVTIQQIRALLPKLYA
jgi:glycosyltransferase involved in cell wall biosynthesis